MNACLSDFILVCRERGESFCDVVCDVCDVSANGTELTARVRGCETGEGGKGIL